MSFCYICKVIVTRWCLLPDGAARCWCRIGNTPAEGIHRSTHGGNYGDAAQDGHGYFVSGTHWSSSYFWHFSFHGLLVLLIYLQVGLYVHKLFVCSLFTVFLFCCCLFSCVYLLKHHLHKFMIFSDFSSIWRTLTNSNQVDIGDIEWLITSWGLGLACIEC